MELLIAWAVIAYVLKAAVVDVAAMATGKTPPSHAYQMAKLKQQGRQIEADPDQRAGFKRVMAHWYRDACEDVDAWRERRRLSKPERRAAKEARKKEKAGVIARAKARLTGEDAAGVDRPRPTPPDAPIPDVPDNVIPLADRRQKKEQEGQGTEAATDGEKGGDQQSQEPKKEDGASSEEEKSSPESPKPASDGASDTNRDTKQSPEELEYPMSDQAGLTPHLMALASARVHCDRAVADIDRIRAQMEEGGVGQSVTDQAGTATDAVKAAEHQLGNAELILETLNRQVLEALASANFEAGDKSYLTPDSSGQSSDGNAGGRS